jgi:CheY-specific phosphatase CheX
VPETSLDVTLSRATADVLEKMFFTGFMAESSRRPDDAGEQIVATLGFEGERRGVLALSISTPAARSLAADFLGVESEKGPDRAQVNEVVLELANMICGDALSTLERNPLVLSSPRIETSSGFLPSSSARSRSFDLGNGWLTVTLDLQDCND